MYLKNWLYKIWTIVNLKEDGSYNGHFSREPNFEILVVNPKMGIIGEGETGPCEAAEQTAS